MIESIMGAIRDYYLWMILLHVAVMAVICFLWGYVMGMAAVEIEEEESHS